MAKDEVKIYAEEPRRYLIARAVASFEKGKEAVESAKGGKFRVPAVWVNQQAREERGYQDDISRNGNWVKEGVLYQKDKRIIIPTGLCYLHLDKAVNAHRQEKEYTLEGCTKDEIARTEAEGLEIKASDLRGDGHLAIPCADFGSNKYGLFLFGGKGTDEERSKRAAKSGEWLINAPENIKEVVLHLDGKDYSKSIGKDYATQMWFLGLGYRSELYGGGFWYWFLRYEYWLLGLFDSAEGVVKNSAGN